VLLLVLLLLSLKNRIIFKISARDIPRRPAQTLLIVAGLTFSTVIITAALTTGDTLSFSGRSQATTSLGQIDYLISPPASSETQAATIDATRFEELRTEIAADQQIDAVVPAIIQGVALTNEADGQGEPAASLFAPGPEYDQQLADLRAADGSTVALSNLAAGEVYLNEKGASLLAVQAGDTIEAFSAGQSVALTVKQVILNRALLSGDRSAVIIMPLAEAQATFGIADKLTSILVSGTGDDSARLTAAEPVVERLRGLVADNAVAQEIVTTLREADVRSVLNTEAAALPDQQSRLQEQSAALLAGLDEANVSPALLATLADDGVSAWILSRPLPQATLDDLSAHFNDLSELNVSDIKARALAEADQSGSVYSQLFLVFGTFSIFAGMLLIFQIFVMLAAERKSELGMARAVGVQRLHLIQMFVTTGVIYDLLAAVAGTVLGLAISYVMVAIIGDQLVNLSSLDSSLTFYASPRSLGIALCLGVLTTLLIVIFSAWRISRLNIIAAIRSLPDEMQSPKRGILSRGWSLLRGPLLLLLGGGLLATGQSTSQLTLAMIGVGLLIIGVGLTLSTILDWTSLRPLQRDRIVFTVIGLGLLAFYAAPFGTWDDLLGLGGLESTPDVFIISGVMIVAGAIWTFIYNGDLLLGLFNVIFSRIGSLTPVLKTATAYPLSARFRTGMTLAMFSIIIFTVIVMTIVTQADEQVLGQRGAEVITGGYDIQAVVTGAPSETDLRKAIATGDQQSSIVGVGEVTVAPIEIRQVGASTQRWSDYRINGYDDTYINQVEPHFGFKLKAPGYETDQQIWQALRERDDVMVVGRADVPSSQSVRLDQNAFMLESFFWEDETLPDVEVEVRNPQSGETRRLKVIGVLNSSWIGNFLGGVHTGQQTVTQIAGDIPPSIFFIDAQEGADNQALAQAIEKEFVATGLETTAMRQLITESLASSKAFNQLLQGFISLGLFIGVASLAVISSRSVIERRQQIGMLRAIGYQRGMVWLSFLLEAAFIAVLGVAIGTLLGLNTGWNIINQFAKEQPGMFFDPPLTQILIIDALALGFALLATLLPAWRATRIYPAEALRYE
ncbi:MAG: FtsX-like permease family protein, partial [Chloroflexi bacterium]|nr:FtsX-like permease family protein [Chloroflexota bacterium]